ncbi:MAG TPA: primosomal protein N' [Gemmatimonadales bacterium]|nr:primosomal protein N' [Gemmatimonadales bacterium]
MTAGAGFAQVALPVAVPEPYTYLIPDALADRVVPGARVVVPLRNRELVGIVTAVDVPPPPAAAKPILGVPDPDPAIAGPLLETVKWMAGYYATPLGLALKAVLPAGLWGASQVVMVREAGAVEVGGTAAQLLDWLDRRGGEAAVATAARALKRPMWEVVNRLARIGALSLRVEPPETAGSAATERVLILTGTGLPLLERDRIFGRAREQRRLFETLEELGGSATTRHLTERLGFGDSVVKGLVARRLARLEQAERIRDPFADEPGTPPPAELTDAQRAALAAIATLAPGQGALLFGVTGSGKTLVYLEAIRAALAAGRGAIILVPEIALTPQTVRRVRGAFGDQVAVLHSALSDGERADAWRLLHRGERRVAVGARSALFAPVRDLGVLVVDEEHEASYKNGEAPRYHARDVAAVRARLEGARLVLGSATPSVETWARVRAGKLPVIRLPERVGVRPMPPVEVVDLRTAPRVPGTGAIPWSEALERGILGALDRQEQVLLLLNRRGFAAYLQCESCGAVRECPNCSIALTVHRTPPRLACHYCAHAEPVPTACAECGHAVQQERGIGIQQLEALLTARYPTARLARMDLDTTSTRWGHHRILEAVERGEVDILFGTQMIAKGLDFPNVTLVGVVDADTGLYLPDFRAAERTFQLLAQVAGRAGRGPKGGRVLIQTRRPDHHAVRFAAGHDVEGFLAAEGAERASPPYPPEVAIANVLVTGPSDTAVSGRAAEVADWCHGLVDAQRLPLTVLGPAPCTLARIKDRWRWHVVLKGPPEEIGRFVRYAAPRWREDGRGVRVVVDRDPVSLL